MNTEKGNIEVKTFFDGIQNVTDAFAFLISQRIRKNVTNEIVKDIAPKEDLRYNTDTKVINRLPSGYVGD